MHEIMAILMQMLPGVLAAALIALGAWRFGMLAPSGAVAAMILGSLVFGAGGLAWAVPLITFFLLSSLLSRGSRRLRARQAAFETVFEKGSRRDAGQVVANGGVAGLLALVYLIDPAPILYIGYFGALAAAAADTWGTEIGVLSRGRVISVATLREVEPGRSGGISLGGTLGAVGGALSVALSGFLSPLWSASIVPLVVGSGLAGMLADSLAGATVQALYLCPVCGVVTERTRHCETPTTLVQGIRMIGNDPVNIICTTVGALVAMLLAR
jgi:uncharacterized protein (TIGR00297 family)